MANHSKISADLILQNGRIVTVDPQFNIATSLAVRKEEILAVGTKEELIAFQGKDTKLIDLGGKTVIPGLIDVHFQFQDRSAAQYYGAHVDLPSTVADVINAVKAATERIPEGQYITCNSGWYPHMLVEERVPTIEELDAVAPNHPVVLWGEFYYCNSVALKMNGIDRNTEQPENGWIGKDERTGELTGVLYGSAINLVDQAFRTFTPEQRAEALRWSSRQMIEAGVTSLRDPKRSTSDIKVYQALNCAGELPLRVSVQRFIPSNIGVEQVLDMFRDEILYTPLGTGRFQIDRAGYFYTDGGYHRMKLSVPVKTVPGIPEDGGQYFEKEQSQESLEKIVVGMSRMGFTGSIMAAGDEALELALRALEKADDEVGISDRRWVLAHVIYPTRQQLKRIRKLGAIVTPMWHHYYYYPTQVFYHGEDFAQKTDPFQDMLDEGVTVAQGTDVSTIPLNYFAGFHFMVTRNTWKWGKANPHQAVSREQALRMMTINGAFTTFEEHRKGSLEAGKYADLVILSDDLMTVPEDEIPHIKVLATMVGGKFEYQSEKFD